MRSEMDTIYDAIEHAAANLPDGWTIHIRTENGAAWLELEAPGGVMHAPQYPDDSMAEKIGQLTAYAIKHA